MKVRLITIAALSLGAMPLARASMTHLITDSDFETGDLTGWSATSTSFGNVTGSCNDGFAAQSTAAGCVAGTDPAFGTYAAYSTTSFPNISDDTGTWINRLSQDFTVPSSPFDSATLSLEYTATWDGTGSEFLGVVLEVDFYQASAFVTNFDLIGDRPPVEA